MLSKIIATLRTVVTEPSLRKLRNRLLTVNLISLTLVIVVAFTLIFVDYYNRAQNEIEATLDSIPPGVLENLLRSQQAPATTGFAEAEDGEITISGEPVIPADYSKSFVVNILSDGTVTVFSMLDFTYDDYAYAVTTALEKRASEGELNMADRKWRYSVKEPPEHLRGRVSAAYESSIVFLDVDEASRGIRDLAISLFVIGILAIGAILLVSLLVANRAIRPVEEIMSRQKRFVADASHELKTPIAVIAASAEAAKDEAGEHKGVTRWIDNIADEAHRMDGLVKSLLALAKAEEIQGIETEFDFYEAIREEAVRVETFLFERNIVFSFEPPPGDDGPLTIRSDRAKVRSILSVLIENAVKYTPDGGHVTITAGRTKEDGEKAERSKGKARVAVANTGEFIPPEDVERLFDRFYRTDRSRNSETGGHGIGLSIANEIALSLGGTITAASEKQADGSAVNTFTLFI